MNIHQNNNIIINKMIWINLIWIFILYNNKTALAFKKEERPTTTPNGNSLYKQKLSTATDDASISYITQSPIGNIVYEIEVDNDDDADGDEDDDGTDNHVAIIASGERTTRIAGGNSQNKYLNKHVNAVNRILSNHASKLNYHQHHRIYINNNNNFEQKKQQRQQQQKQQQLQHQHVISSYTSAADKLKEKQMNHKNWDKTNKHHKSNIYRTQMKHNNKEKHKLKSTYRNGGNRAHGGGDGGFIQAHVNYFDKPMHNNNNFQYNKYQDKIIAQSKWPHIERVRQLHELHQYIEDDLPPYIKKYNRRNKQLLDLLEGTISPAALYDYQNYHHHHHHHHHHHNKHHNYKDHQRKEQQQQRQQNSKWVEKNLFEVQRPAVTVTPTTVAISTISNLNNNNNNNNVSNQSPIISNELPDQHLHIPDTENTLTVSNTHNSTIYTISPKADKFVYHRIASPKLIGLGGTYGSGYKKQRLPFVAITDKRLAPAKKNLRNSSNEQNNLPMP